jgi:NTP pyrophosphatase (non-canonical NTP hydrolase)
VRSLDDHLKNNALLAVEKERFRQNAIWGRQRHSYGDWLKILVEEVGEVAQAMQIGDVSYKNSDSDDLYKELIQVAAVAVAIAEQVEEEREINNV